MLEYLWQCIPWLVKTLTEGCMWHGWRSWEASVHGCPTAQTSLCIYLDLVTDTVTVTVDLDGTSVYARYIIVRGGLVSAQV